MLDCKENPLLRRRHVEDGFTTKLLIKLLCEENVQEAEINTLLFKIPIHDAEPPHYNGVKVSLSALLKKNIISDKILTFLFDCGMVTTEEDIKLAIKNLPEKRGINTMNLILLHVDGSTKFDQVCLYAYTKEKFSFVLCLLKKGSELPCTSQEILQSAIEKKFIRAAESFLPFCTLSEVDLGQLMVSCKELLNHQQLIVKMIDGGVNPSGLGDNKPLMEVMKVSNISRRVDLICLLLDKGCDCTQLCSASVGYTTPIHIAVLIGLEARGCTKVLEAVIESRTFHVRDYQSYIDYHGKSPSQLIQHSNKSQRGAELLKALEKIPMVTENPKKEEEDDIIIEEEKSEILQKVVQQAESTRREKENNSSEKTPNDNKKKVRKGASQQPVNEKHFIRELSKKLENQLQLLKEKQGKCSAQSTSQDSRVVRMVNKDCNDDIEKGTDKKHTVVVGVRKSSAPVHVDQKDTRDINTVMSKYGFNDFDKLQWEVEITNSALKFFKDFKKHPYSLRLQAAKTVKELAEGIRNQDLCKKVSPYLFEARINKYARILWQVAIQFSTCHTGKSLIPIYAQVIRIWEIVTDHDQLTKTINDTGVKTASDAVVKQINQSNERGMMACLNIPLRPHKSVKKQEKLAVPSIFTKVDTGEVSDEDVQHFRPAASHKEKEFNVTTFYSFSGAMIKKALTGNLAKCDFPFKEWPKEHEIINLPHTESILLLGRSGTGKTTCCLYRLWNEFKLYWGCPKPVRFPRKCLVGVLAAEQGEEEGNINVEGEEKDEKEENADNENVVNEEEMEIEEEEKEEKEYQKNNCNQKLGEEQKQQDADFPQCLSQPSLLTTQRSEEDDDKNSVNDGEATDGEEGSCKKASNEVEEHLHQVFITKNYVLCSQIKKKFYEMAASHEFLEQHVDWKTKDIPHSFSDIDDLAYPLFLTARQFYILLDNSISREHHDCFFRPREKDGSLRVKIVSSDYDHEDPDTLLDLEDSDNEEDDISTAGDPTVPFATKQPSRQKFVEVTSLYFTDKIWPEISQKCKAKHLDPLLVWIEIQSFIKGSRNALLRGSALPLEEYCKIGNKMAPNFSSERDTIYNLYQLYEQHCRNKRHSVFLFDECDLVHDLHRRLRQVQDLPWSIHTLYIDEVQDFTQAELALYLHCCRHPNSLFFTGDTAQSIMRGVAFRFEDLRSLFHAVHEAVPQVKVPQKPHTLTINFRSHSGILRLAGSVIDLLQEFFKGSIDYLPADEGMFPGPTPVVLASCEESNLALLLSSNKRESSRIEFGAHQVVLVQSKEAKENLPPILKGAIVLTIFESKGLEFDDVLLYNFFSDSMAEEKDWRVVTAYLEEHSDCIKVKESLPGSSNEPRSNRFDEKQHKTLNSELKYLYTAITRAKCNLWIYDSNTKKRLPMFDLWYKRGLVEVVGEGLSGTNPVFATTSISQEWKTQGDYFMQRSCWEQAKHCYEEAGITYLGLKATAMLAVQQASKQAKPQLYLKAAVDFLECNHLEPNTQSILTAAKCLRRAKPQQFEFAAILFEHLGEYTEALKCYRKVKDVNNCVRLLEREKRYDEAVRMYRSPKEQLIKAVDYTSKGIRLSQELLPDNLSYMYASQCAKHKDKVTLMEMLPHMSDSSRKAYFLKKCGLHKEALKEYVSNGELEDAYRLASGQCMFSDGRKIAKNHKHSMKEAEFVFHQVHHALIKGGPFPDQLKSDLHELKKVEDTVIKANANLLLGKVTKDAGLCQAAHATFDVVNEPAALEAFDLLTLFVKPPRRQSVSEVLTVCNRAKDLELSLRESSDIHKHVKQASTFYGLQKVGDVYLTPPNHNVWVSVELKSQCLIKPSKDQCDDDGYLKLESSSTRELLANHVSSFMKRWLAKYNIETTITRSLTGFVLYADMQKKVLSRFYSEKEVPVDLISRYVEALVSQCRLGILLDDRDKSNAAISTLLTIFSPEVSMHIHLRPAKHVELVQQATTIHKFVINDAEACLCPENIFQIDKFFSAWRACCLCNGNVVDGILDNWEYEHNKKVPLEPHHAYMFWKCEQKYYHIFSYWMYSCTLLKQNKPVGAGKHAIYYFLGKIAQRKSLSISVMNLVNVLIVHSMAVFAMLTQLNHQLKNRGAKFVLPLPYSSAVELFDAFNCNEKEQTLYCVCSDEVRRSIKFKRHQKLYIDCCNLLERALNILLGIPKGNKVLRSTFNKVEDVKNGTALHCLMLGLTIFANISPYLIKESQALIRAGFVLFFNEIAHLRYVGKIVKEGRGVLETPTNNILEYVGKLLATISPEEEPTQAFMMVNDRGRIMFNPLPRKHASLDLQELNQNTDIALGLQSQQVSSPIGFEPAAKHTDIPPHQPRRAQSQPSTFLTITGGNFQPVNFSSDTSQHGLVSNSTSNTTNLTPQQSVSMKTMELPQLQRSQSQSNTTSSHETVEYYREDGYDVDDDSEEGDGAPSMSTLHRSLQPKLPPVEPHLIDPKIVKEDFCNICGVDLMSKQTDGADEGKGIVKEYEIHVRSKNHEETYQLYKHFNKELAESFLVMVDELSSLQSKLEGIQALSFARLIDDINEVQTKYRRQLADLQEKLKWREGLDLISKALDVLQALLNRGNREYEKFMTEHPTLEYNREENYRDSDSEFHEELSETVADDFTFKPRSEASKMQSRNHKRNRKN